jgi:hypothetical protein
VFRDFKNEYKKKQVATTIEMITAQFIVALARRLGTASGSPSWPQENCVCDGKIWLLLSGSSGLD